MNNIVKKVFKVIFLTLRAYKVIMFLRPMSLSDVSRKEHCKVASVLTPMEVNTFICSIALVAAFPLICTRHF